MSIAHPFQRTDVRTSVLPRRRRPSTVSSSDPAATEARAARTAPSAVFPGTRTPAGLPRDLALDESGKPRRSVLLAAIMIRRGRSVAEIAQATGLAPDVVTCLSRSV